jgi:hypothetical protein
VTSAVAVRIFHLAPGDGEGTLERALATARLDVATRHAELFRDTGTEDVEIVAGPPDGVPFGARIRALVERERPGGIVLINSGALALATREDLAEFVAVAGSGKRVALANNRYSADAIAIGCADSLLALPDLPADNALPRWLAEVAGYDARDLARRWRLGVDLDTPLDAAIIGRPIAEAQRAMERLRAVGDVGENRRAQLLVAGRTSAATLRWLERNTRARVRALVEERGLRASAALARSDAGASRRPRSVVGLLLDRAGPESLGSIVGELADAAVIDTRVLVAHRFGADESRWPSAEDRFASDLLLPERIDDPWLRELTAGATDASIPIALGGHTLVGPGLRIALGGHRR